MKIADDITVSEAIFKRLFTKNGDSGSDLLFSYFESTSDATMKDFILYPQKRLQLVPSVYFAPIGTGLTHLGHFAQNNSYLIIFLQTNKEKGVISVCDSFDNKRSFIKKQIE